MKGTAIDWSGAGLAAALDYAVGSHRRTVTLLIAVSLLAFLPGFFQIPPVDRDEARFAQATKQMLETREYVDIRFQDEVRYKKPVGIYWLQAVAVKAGEAIGVPQARTTIWLYRLPSLFGATFAVLLTYWAALAFVPRRTALVAALMMASSVLLGVEGAPKQMPCCFRFGRSHGRWRTIAPFAEPRTNRLDAAGDSLDGACRRRVLKGL